MGLCVTHAIMHPDLNPDQDQGTDMSHVNNILVLKKEPLVSWAQFHRAAISTKICLA